MLPKSSGHWMNLGQELKMLTNGNRWETLPKYKEYVKVNRVSKELHRISWFLVFG